MDGVLTFAGADQEENVDRIDLLEGGGFRLTERMLASRFGISRSTRMLTSHTKLGALEGGSDGVLVHVLPKQYVPLSMVCRVLVGDTGH